MPFQSEAQRRYMYSQHPDIAKRWTKEFPNQHNLPEYKKKKKERTPLHEYLDKHKS